MYGKHGAGCHIPGRGYGVRGDTSSVYVPENVTPCIAATLPGYGVFTLTTAMNHKRGECGVACCATVDVRTKGPKYRDRYFGVNFSEIFRKIPNSENYAILPK
jgi:hypothetical protein